MNGNNESTTLVINCDTAVTAIFAQTLYSLAISSKPSDCGKVSVDTPPPSPEGYPAGTEVTISATANKGYQFSRWSGDNTDNENQITITIDSDKQLTAHFISRSTFAWWCPVAGIGAISIILLVYFRLIRKSSIARNFLI